MLSRKTTCFLLLAMLAQYALADENADTKATVKKDGSQSASEKQSAKKTPAGKKAAAKDSGETPAVRLESIFVGDKEQPAVSYFIPWQGIGAPDKLYWHVEEKHDKALDLVDRDIMLRSIHFYEEMQLETPNK